MVEDNITAHPEELWKFLRTRQGASRIPGRVFDGEGAELTDPQDIVDAFAASFSAHGSSFDPPASGVACAHTSGFSLRCVTENEVLAAMGSLANKFTAGDDSLPSYIVRDCRYALCQPVLAIVNCAIRTCTFPSLWKQSRISPVLKKGDSACIANYRPISILSNFAKVMEQMLCKQIYYNVISHISPRQHGFLSGRSTMTNLATISQDLCEAIDERGQVDVIYTDFSRAFDTIPHGVLLDKLEVCVFCLLVGP